MTCFSNFDSKVEVNMKNEKVEIKTFLIITQSCTIEIRKKNFSELEKSK